MKTKAQKVKEAEARVVNAAERFAKASVSGVTITFEMDGLEWWETDCALIRAVAALKKARER